VKAAGVVEVEVAREDDVDVLRARRASPTRDRDGSDDPTRKSSNAASPFRPSPASMIIVRAPRTISGPHAERDSVTVVGWRRDGPLHLRHDAEHQPAVHTQKTVGQGNQLELAEGNRRISDMGGLRSCGLL
jgi:hypothetical protein